MTGSVAGIDLTDASVWERGTPHDWLDQVRDTRPLYFHPEPDGPGFWAVTRHEDVRAVSSDPATFSSWVGGPLRLDPPPDDLEQLRMVIIGMDPPEHRNFRDVVARAFTPKRISSIEPTLRAETRRVFADLRERRSCDFVADAAAIIPMWSISELMGVPRADRHRLYELSHSLIDDQDPEVAPTPDTSIVAAAEIFGYAMDMANRERANPGDNLTGDLLSAEVDGRRFDDLEFTLFFVFLIVAGNETTRTATSHGLLTLLDHPDQFRRLREDPSLIPGAVEEILRWEPPIHHFRRTATRDVDLAGQTIAGGDKVVMWYAGANRDPAVFDDRHVFDITRSPNRQLSFGIGEHFCLGANLARLQLRVFFEELVASMDDIELAAPARRLHSNLINGIKEMQITYRPLP